MTDPNIPMLDLGPELAMLESDLSAAWQSVLKSGRFINGPNVSAFESEIAEFLGVEHAVGVNSGTDALVIGLRALGVVPGDEVITTPFTFFATAEAVSVIGATPVFVDIEEASFNIDPAALEGAITPRTRVVIPVHLFGQPADMAPIQEIADRHGLMVLEDTAQAIGADYRGRKLGSLGHAGAFSFFPSKNLGAYGDGGLITTNDSRSAELARMLRAHGGRDKYFNEMVGYNSRLDELQAAILRVKLRVLPENTEGRRRVARRYDEALAGHPQLVTPPIVHGDHVFHQYTVRIREGQRDRVQREMRDNGIASAVYYQTPLHRLPVYDDLDVSCPVAEAAADQVLSLPIWPQMDEPTQERVCSTLLASLRE